MADLALSSLSPVHIKPKACDECRQLHRKCDSAKPECSLCKQNGRVCRRKTSNRLRFKQGMQATTPLALHQTTLAIPKSLQFVDETADIVRVLDPAVEASSRPGPQPWSSISILQSHYAGNDNVGQSILGKSFERRWPLVDVTEILLFEHFTHNLSKFFDFCDETRRFEIDVPRRARTCQSLLAAIFAVSSRHLSMIKRDFDSYIADYFYHRCLQNLIPELDKEGSSCNDNLLAATVILRLLEELNAPLAGLDHCHHSLGTQAFLRSQSSGGPGTGLQQAAAWAGVRQEIYASLTMHRPPAIKATAGMLDSLTALQDCAWANRAVNHCSEVLEFCFAETRGTRARYDDLLQDILQWDLQRPDSYDPLCFLIAENVNTNPLWDVRMHTDWHVMGWQYITLARIALILHDPRASRVGLDRQSSWVRINDQARSALKLLCSIAVSNPKTPGAIVVACMGIKMCGDLVEGGGEQQSVLDVLTRAETAHGWPTRDLQLKLKEVWAGKISVENS